MSLDSEAGDLAVTLEGMKSIVRRRPPLQRIPANDTDSGRFFNLKMISRVFIIESIIPFLLISYLHLLLDLIYTLVEFV